MKYSKLLCLFFFLFSSISLMGDENEDLTLIKESTKSDIHGLMDISFKNDYITPRGLLVTNSDLAVQVLYILFLDLYNNQDSCFLNKTTLVAGVWNDIWTGQPNHFIQSWNELDWFIGLNFALAKHWKFGVQFAQFLSPPYNFRPENNIEFLLSYDDSYLGYPVVLNPYMKLFWTVSGDSTVVVGARGDTFDVELGIIPTIDLSKQLCINMPISLSAPTWLTVGPAGFWNGGTNGLKNVNTNCGVFTTGLRAEFALTAIPKRLGNWYFDVEGRYYHLINTNLLEAQVFTLNLPSIDQAHRNVGVMTAGFGFTY